MFPVFPVFPVVSQTAELASGKGSRQKKSKTVKNRQRVSKFRHSSPKFRNENQPKDRSFWPDVPADIRPKTSVRPSKSWKKQAFWHGHAARTSTKKLRSEKHRADFSFPTKWKILFLAYFGRTPKGAYSTRGRSRHLLETPFSEPLLRTLLRTLLYCKTPQKKTPFSEPF